jgi:hypothetical protein
MARDKLIIEKSKNFLLKNNEGLRSLTIEPLCDSNVTVEQLADFIETCWTRDYGSEGRIIFSPEFIEFNIPDIKKDCISIVGKIDGQLVASFLFFPMNYRIGEAVIRAGIVTGLSTHEKLRGKRVSQFLVLCIEDNLINNQISFAKFWLDNRHHHEGGSYQTYKKEKKRTEWNKTVSLYVKPFDVKKLSAATKLSSIEKAGAKFMQWRFPSKMNLPRGCEILQFRKRDMDDWLNFINSNQPKGYLSRYFTGNELEHKLTYCKGRTRAAALRVVRGGVTQGVFYGFTVPIGDSDSYIQLDGVILHRGLSRSDKRKIIGSCERTIIDEYGCFSSAMPASATPENLADFGYVKLITQTLGANFYAPNIPQDALNSLLVELR